MLVMCERWVGDGTDCNILTQSSSRDHSSTSSSSWLGCSTVGRWGPKLSGAVSHSTGILSPTVTGTELEQTNELIQAVCGTWLYNCLMPTCFLWAYASTPNSTTSTGLGDIPISSTGCTCFTYLHRCISWLTARSRVNMLYKNILLFDYFWPIYRIRSIQYFSVIKE